MWLPEQDAVGAWHLLAEKARGGLLERAVSVIDLRFLPNGSGCVWTPLRSRPAR